MYRNSKHKQAFWSRRQRPDEPLIIVNDITYRSPQEMPEDVRAIWYENERQLEKRGIDWRKQKRIILTWTREGNFVRQDINIEGNPRRLKSRPWTLLGAATLGFVICWAALSFYGFGWQVPPLVFAVDNTYLSFLFGLLYTPWVLLFLNAYRKRQYELSSREYRKEDSLVQLEKRNNLFLNPETSVWKLVSTTLITLAGTLLVNYYATFGGAAKLLHYTARKPGEATATISAKYSYSRKYARCVPRIEFQGFRHVGDELCVDRKFFDLVQIGDSVRITGRVSRYAIEPEKLEVVTPATLSGKGT